MHFFIEHGGELHIVLKREEQAEYKIFQWEDHPNTHAPKTNKLAKQLRYRKNFHKTQTTSRI